VNRPAARRDRTRGGRTLRRVAGTATLATLLLVMVRPDLLPASGDARDAMARGRYAEAVEHYAREAATDDPRALTALGNLHYLGMGTVQDPAMAARLYHRAAGMGHTPAQINLGNLYSQGLGVPLNALRAFGWYNMASIHGSPAAEYYLYQISVEYTISPLQQSSAAERWRSLDLLMAEAL